MSAPAGVEDYGHLITVILVTGGGFAITVANAVFFDKARKNCNSISTTTADVMFWLNVFLAVVFGILFFWTIIRVFISPTFRSSGKPPPESRTEFTPGAAPPTTIYGTAGPTSPLTTTQTTRYAVPGTYTAAPAATTRVA